MPRIIRNTLLQYIPETFVMESVVNPLRIFELNNKPIKGGYVVYFCEREIRVKDNFALQFAIAKSKELSLPLKIVCPKMICEYKPKQDFLNSQIEQIKTDLDFEIIDKADILKIKIALLVIDFNPIQDRNYLKNLSCKIYEIDGHNIIPARFVSDKQEYGAATLRRKIYYNIYPFLTEFDNINSQKVEAEYVLEDFIKNKLDFYAEFKNNPEKDVLSGLSKYLNLGFISSQRTALEVIKSNSSAENKEVFLEELIVRKELADNFCFYCKKFKSLNCIPAWAKASLDSRKSDIRVHIYSREEMEQAQTGDKAWNEAQNQLVKTGVIHGYLRMYWAKKILEWSLTPECALDTAIYLNDKYAYDAPSANGYTGILWSIGGLHDRAFRDWPVTGKIRRMNLRK